MCISPVLLERIATSYEEKGDIREAQAIRQSIDFMEASRQAANIKLQPVSRLNNGNKFHRADSSSSLFQNAFKITVTAVAIILAGASIYHMVRA